MAHWEASAEWWIQPDPIQKAPMWKLSSKSQPEFRPRHEKAEIAQSQTTASGPEAAAKANDAESDAWCKQCTGCIGMALSQLQLQKLRRNKKRQKKKIQRQSGEACQGCPRVIHGFTNECMTTKRSSQTWMWFCSVNIVVRDRDGKVVLMRSWARGVGWWGCCKKAQAEEHKRRSTISNIRV